MENVQQHVAVDVLLVLSKKGVGIMGEKYRSLKEDLEIISDEARLNQTLRELVLPVMPVSEIACHWIPKLTRLVRVDEWSGQFLVNDAYRPIAEALVKKYDELKHVRVNEILFIDNLTGKGTTLDKRKNAQVSRIPAKWQEIIAQLTGRNNFSYFMEFYKVNISQMSREQIVTLIYHELRHFGPDGKLRHHDIEEWNEIAQKMGPGWSNAHKSIPDLLDESFDWENIQNTDGLFAEHVDPEHADGADEAENDPEEPLDEEQQETLDDPEPQEHQDEPEPSATPKEPIKAAEKATRKRGLALAK